MQLSSVLFLDLFYLYTKGKKILFPNSLISKKKYSLILPGTRLNFYVFYLKNIKMCFFCEKKVDQKIQA